MTNRQYQLSILLICLIIGIFLGYFVSGFDTPKISVSLILQAAGTNENQLHIPLTQKQFQWFSNNIEINKIEVRRKTSGY